jgi:hypothetical protein
MITDDITNRTQYLNLISKQENDNNYYINTYRYNVIPSNDSNNIWICREYTEVIKL